MAANIINFRMALLRHGFGYGMCIACFATVAVYEKTFPLIHTKRILACGCGYLELFGAATALGGDINNDQRILGVNFLDNSAQIQAVHREGLSAKQNARKHKGADYHSF
ncbi:MAG: hypothetical protein OEV89_08920 [Desulfobulbaceae bacterium]|nr:hypothetical protein [Desulfobulbaceae bacterium]HIJ90813.1 hypothetical protein [Deltaproteobacteria bacterium]